tara:strand:+ start:1021 stop:1857 length:837 start_codon:yes stop_codon:yes gene_type:complete
MSAAAFDADAFSRALRTSRVGRRFEYRASTSSTMTDADAFLCAEGAAAAHGLLVLAEAQTAGVGRRGRSWESAPDGNLYFSLIWAPSNAADAMAMMPEVVRLNLAAGVAVTRACASVGMRSARIKWPNDVWAGSPARKLSGTILNFNGKDAAVLGVGINVLQGGSVALPNATSVATELSRQQDDRTPSREQMLATFCTELERLMALSTAAVLDEYRTTDLLAGTTVRVHHRTREEDDPRDYDAKVLGVDAQGMLRVRAPGGEERSLSGEEVSISPKGV